MALMGTNLPENGEALWAFHVDPLAELTFENVELQKQTGFENSSRIIHGYLWKASVHILYSFKI